MPPASFLKKSRVGENVFLDQQREFSPCGFSRRNWRAGPIRSYFRRSNRRRRFASLFLANPPRWVTLQPSYGAGRYMEALLRGRFPGEKFEVINLGVTAINSHVILPIARECARHDGDFWIVYMGNNETVGPYGAATVFTQRAGAAPQCGPVQPCPPADAHRPTAGFRDAQAGRQKSKNTFVQGGMEMFHREPAYRPTIRCEETVYRNFEGQFARHR